MTGTHPSIFLRFLENLSQDPPTWIAFWRGFVNQRRKRGTCPIQPGKHRRPPEHVRTPSRVSRAKSRLLGQTEGPKGIAVSVTIIVLAVKPQQSRGRDDFFARCGKQLEPWASLAVAPCAPLDGASRARPEPPSLVA